MKLFIIAFGMVLSIASIVAALVHSGNDCNSNILSENMRTPIEIIKSFLIFMTIGITIAAIVFEFLFLVTYAPVYLLWGILVLVGTCAIYESRNSK